MTAPARLTAIRLHGFKSFAERTVVEFQPGISAIVGPNGSGKSNLADALRWALGEQGRALRSRRSEDVIFAGSEKRAALGMADVTIVLDNSDGMLPVEYGTVELGRRLYRSGENDYLLNRQRVRLRDLIDLLDAAHLAENAFLFIGQGMVDQALALRPEERRPLFEEVAGVRRHERRRRKAEEQLAEAEVNLARVDDILAELRPQARRLAAQAEQQRSRATAGEELATALVVAAHGRWHEAAGRQKATTAQLGRARAEADRAMGDLAGSEAAVATISAEMAARADLERERRETHEASRAALTALQLQEARLSADLGAIARDRARLDDERRVAEADLSRRRREMATPIPERDPELVGDVDQAERGLAEALEELGALRAARQARGDNVQALRRAEAARTAELETARRRLGAAERRRAEVSAGLAAVSSRHVAEEQRLAGARTELEAAVAVEAHGAGTRELARTAAETAEGERRVASERVAALSARLAAVGGRLEAARARLAEDESRGIARAARKAGGRRVDEDLQVDPALRAAVEAALGEVARAYVVERAAVAEMAKERGVVVVADSARVSAGGPGSGATVSAGASALASAGASAGASPGAAPGSAPGNAGVRAFVDRVAAVGGGLVVDGLRRDPLGAARRVLERAAWVPTINDLLAVQDAIPDGWIVVCRDGAAVASSLAVTLGRGDTPLERRAELAVLEAERARLATEAEQGERLAGAAAAQAAEARTAMERQRREEAVAGNARRSAEQAERSAGRDVESSAREAAWHAAQLTRAEHDVTEQGIILASLEAAAAARANAPADEAGTDTAAAIDTWQDRVAELRARRDRVAARLAEADRARREAEAVVARAGAAVAYAEQALSRADADVRALAERESALVGERDGLSSALAAAVSREAQAREVLETLRSADAADRGRLQAAEAASVSARERLRIAEEHVRTAELADIENRIGLDSIREQLLVEVAGLGPVGLRALAAVVGPERAAVLEAGRMVGADASTESDETAILESLLPEVAAVWEASEPQAAVAPPGRLVTLRRRYHDLGATNPFAIEEHAAAQTRLTSLEQQRDDLRSAITRTRTLIEELSTMISEQFRTTFRALELAFDQRFQQLFGGGYARLELTDPADISSTGVDIVARPPGKKAQALAMLSGGERALTAVALLFAMLEIHPVPFCVLDEVDAALDEANIGRVTDALRSLADRTQFLVITHNRGTIEAADALYGVTVGDDSVSRVISLRLEEARAMATG